jgi:hypothetical protein
MQMPTPTAAHLRLERLVGKWRGEERVHPSPFDPVGGPAVGRVDNRMALDGFAVIQDYEQERGGRVAFRGHGVFRFDPSRNLYALTWFDSAGQPPSEFWGTFEGEVLTVTQVTAQGQVRASWDLRDPNRYTYQMDVSADGRSWAPFMSGSYVRET